MRYQYKNFIVPVPTYFLGAILSALLCACAGVGKSAHVGLSPRAAVSSGDRVFMRVIPFDTVVRTELERVNLDPDLTYQNLASELRYQLFLNRQEESPDSAGATVVVSITINKLQPGSANSGGVVSGTLKAERNQKVESVSMELRAPPGDNIPGEFLPLHVPRALAAEILNRILHSKGPQAEKKKSAIPSVLMIF